MKKSLAVLLMSAFVLAGCSSAQPPQETVDATPDTQSALPVESTPESSMMPESSSSPSAAMENAKSFTVKGSNYSFDTKQIKVKQGDTVQITFENDEGFHDFRIDEFNAFTKQLPAGQSETITFVANKKGTFEYYCSVGQHRKMGMVGKLIVE